MIIYLDCKASTVPRIRVRRSVIRVRKHETAIRIRIVTRTTNTPPKGTSAFRRSVWSWLTISRPPRFSFYSSSISFSFSSSPSKARRAPNPAAEPAEALTECANTRPPLAYALKPARPTHRPLECEYHCPEA